MTRWTVENTDKRHRCPVCHCVMPWRYRPVRKWLYEIHYTVGQFLEFRLPRPFRWLHHLWPEVDHLLPRRCRECGDVVAVPEWMTLPARAWRTFLHRTPIRPDGHDWPDWHHYTGEDQR